MSEELKLELPIDELTDALESASSGLLNGMIKFSQWVVLEKIGSFTAELLSPFKNFLKLY